MVSGKRFWGEVSTPMTECLVQCLLGCLKVSVPIMVTMVHTMVSLLITCFRGKYINFSIENAVC